MSKKQVVEFYSAVDQLLDQQAFVESVEKEFNDIQDPRVKDNLSYPLVALLVIILVAAIAGANAITHIHEYACTKNSLFQRILGIKKTPSYMGILVASRYAKSPKIAGDFHSVDESSPW